jgi:putative PIN family toxin of toxin-antitoxin system
MKVLGRPKFVVYVKPDKAERFLQSLIDLSDLIAITIRIQACRDPADDKFLSLAISGEADCIVTGDEDLLSLNPFQGVAIMTPRQFMNMYVK